MNTYKTLRDKHQQEVSNFPMFFAFSNEQFAEGMKGLGLGPDDVDQVYKFGDTGGYYRRSDAAWLREMLDRHEKERKDAIEADSTGDGYIFDMFLFELANHEYGYTWDIASTLEALDLTLEDVEKSRALKNGLEKAKARFKE